MEKTIKPEHKRWFWKGLWYWLFMIAVTVAMYVLSFVYFGTSALLLTRFKMALGAVILIGAVIFIALGLVGSGWAQEKADEKVRE